MFVGEAVAVIVGFGLTIRFTVFVEVQLPLLPVTVYKVVVVGITVIGFPIIFPGLQVYVRAPDAVRVADDPLQITVGFDVAFTVGIGLTNKEIVLVSLQFAVTPTTV